MVSLESKARRFASLALGVAITAVLQTIVFSQALPERTETIRKDEGFFDAVIRGGCDRSQLAQVMVDNNIHTEQLYVLQKGFVVHLFPGCEKKADAEITKQSNRILAFERGRVGLVHQVAERDQQVVTLQSQKSNLNKLVVSLQKNVADLTGQLKVEQSKFKDLVDSQERTLHNLKVEYGGGGAIIIAIVVALFMVTGGFSMGKVGFYPKEYKVPYLGKKRIFKTRGVYVECTIEGCGRRDITPEGARRHLEEDHEELRCEVIILTDVPSPRWYDWIRDWMMRFVRSSSSPSF